MTIPDRYQQIVDERLLDQFQGSTKLLQLLEAACNRVTDTDTVLDAMESELLNIESGGVWLDLVGAILGLERPLKDFDPSNIFTIRGDDWVSDPDKGVYNSVGGTGGYIQSATGIPDSAGATMSDADYRELLKAKIAAARAAGSIPDIYNFILDGFGVEPAVTVPSINQIDVAFNNSAGLIDDYSFDTGLADWVDNSTGTSAVTWNSSWHSMILTQVTSSSVIADRELTVKAGKHYLIFVNPITIDTSVILQAGTSQGGTDYINESIGSSTDTWVFDIDATSDTLWLRLTTNSVVPAFAININAVQVIPLVTQIQRWILRRIAPNVATTRLSITDWPAI